MYRSARFQSPRPGDRDGGEERDGASKPAFAETDLFESELIDALFDDARSPIIISSIDFRVIKVNRAASMLFGKAPHEAAGLGLEDLFPGEFRDRVAELSRTSPPNGDAFREDVAIVDYLGMRRRFSALIRFLREKNGASPYCLITMRMVMHRADKEITKIDGRFSMMRLMKSIPDPVIIIDGFNRTICDCNAAAEKQYGYRRDELLGRTPHFLALDPMTGWELAAESREAYAKQGFFQAKIRCRRKDGTVFTTLGTNINFFDSRNELKYTVLINRDISETEQRISSIYKLAQKTKECIEAIDREIAPLLDASSPAQLSDLGFSERQAKIAALTCEGESIKNIASRLGVSESTIKSHMHAIYTRLGVSSKIEFVNYLRVHNIIVY